MALRLICGKFSKLAARVGLARLLPVRRRHGLLVTKAAVLIASAAASLTGAALLVRRGRVHVAQPDTTGGERGAPPS